MKILVISQYWHPENGVPQRRWSWFTQILVSAGHEVIVIAPPPHYRRESDLKDWWRDRRRFSQSQPELGISGEQIFRSAFFPAGKSLTRRALNQLVVATGGIWTLLNGPKELKGYKPDLIVATVPALPTSFVGWVASKMLQKPYVIDLRDAWPDLLTESRNWNRSVGRLSNREKILSKGPFQLVSFVTKTFLNMSLRGASALILTSSKLEESLQKRLKNGRAVSCVLRNVFPPEIPEVNIEARLEPNNELNILYAGTLGRAQNLSNALNAADIASRLGTKIRMRFVGDGAAKDELCRVAKVLGVDVEFIRTCPASELVEHYEWADSSLVHLTDWPALQQAVPSKTYELMAIGMHITAVADGETAELIQMLEAGHVVPPEDPVALASLWIHLSQNPGALHVSDSGFQWVQNEREKIVPQKLLELVNSASGSTEIG